MVKKNEIVLIHSSAPEISVSLSLIGMFVKDAQQNPLVHILFRFYETGRYPTHWCVSILTHDDTPIVDCVTLIRPESTLEKRITHGARRLSKVKNLPYFKAALEALFEVACQPPYMMDLWLQELQDLDSYEQKLLTETQAGGVQDAK